MIDYQVSFKRSSESVYIVFASNIKSRSATVTGLTPGTIYNLVVQSRNVVGFSVYSSIATILAA